MDEEIRKQLEYENQFFGLSSQFFADCFKNFIQEEIHSKISSLVNNIKLKLMDQTKNQENFQLALDKMQEDLKNEYNKAIESSFPEIKSKISKFFHIPPNVLLEEDLLGKEGFNGDLDSIKEKNKNLEGVLSSLLYLQKEMIEELQEADSTIFLIEHVLNEKKLEMKDFPVEDLQELSKKNMTLAKNDFS